MNEWMDRVNASEVVLKTCFYANEIKMSFKYSYNYEKYSID